MQLTPKASLAFKKESPSAKTTFGSNVITCLTPLLMAKKGVKTYTDIPIPVAELTTINDNLITAVAARVDGGRSSAAALKTAKAAWNEAFTITANYISAQAEGSEEAIIEAGFIPTKSQTQPKPKPGQASAFKATINGSKGAIIAGTNKGVPTATAYVITALPPGAQISYVNDTIIITVGESSIYLSANTRGKAELYNLPSGVPYTVSMVAINAAGNGPASVSQQVIPQ